MNSITMQPHLPTLSRFLCFIVLALLISCKGDDGAIGPAGPKGDTGAAGTNGTDGTAGATGAQGPKGDIGTANVIYSAWLTASLFNDSTVDNTLVKVGHLRAPEITADILSKGDIHVYFDYGAGTFPLPYTSNAGGKPNTIAFWPKLGKIIPYRFTHDNSNSVGLSTLLKYRYVIIPGGVAAAGRTTAVNFSDYNEVCEYYGIPK